MLLPLTPPMANCQQELTSWRSDLWRPSFAAGFHPQQSGNALFLVSLINSGPCPPQQQKCGHGGRLLLLARIHIPLRMPLTDIRYLGRKSHCLCKPCYAGIGSAAPSSDFGVGSSLDGAYGKHQQAPSDGNGSVTGQAQGAVFSAEFLLRALKAIRAVLPGGSWWIVQSTSQEEKHEISFITAMHRLWLLIAPDWPVLGIAFMALIVAAISEIAIPHYVAATIFSAQKSLGQEFFRNARLLVIMSCTFGLFSGIRGGCFGVANQILIRRMRERLFSTMLSQDIAFFDSEAVGILTSRLGADCQQVSRIFGHDINIMLRNSLQGLGSLLYLLTISKPLALSTLLICSLMWSITNLYGQYQRVAAKSAQDSVASANEVAEETLSLARVVRTFGTEKEEIARYSKWSKKLVDINLRQNVAYGLWSWSSNTLYNATQVVALLIGGSYVMTGKITAEQLTKFVLYSEWVVHSTWWVGDHWASLMQSIGASEKVFELMDLPSSKQLSSKGLQLPKFMGKIQFKDVCFHYPTRPSIPVLQNVNLCVHPGEIVAVVGLSGSGKSTLVGLLLRHYEPFCGEILVDDVPLDELDIKWFRRQLGVVSQEPRLFRMDIASNIAYGCGRNVSPLEIENAARQAHAHDFIMATPEGYNTIVDSARLSGGQKQRIAIARALIRNPVILILDEATSALDAESEYFVQKALDKAMHGGGQQKRTVLVIAHRLSTIRSADRIVVMQGGQIAEVGSHEELLRMNGEYARLTRRQMSTL